MNVQPKSKDVDAYLASVSGEARARLAELREAIKAAAPDAEEVISYQIPTYKQQGALVAFGAARNHAGFYVMSPAVIEEYRDEIKSYGTAKVTIQFPLDKPIPAALIMKLVKARIAENESQATAKGYGRKGR
jgi:uncharacterized protein YdhG (YjbR/CyaY superfamily)